MEESTRKKKPIWQTLFPATGNEGEGYASTPVAPPVGGYDDFVRAAQDSGGVFETSSEDEKGIHSLPADRLGKYKIFRVMAQDPTISGAIKMLVAQALSPRTDTGEIIAIESTGDEKDPIVVELRNSIAAMLNRDCHFWGYNAAVNGCWFVRAYGEQGVGVTSLRSDFYMHPRHVSMYERAGQLAGFVSTYQQPTKGGVTLIEPWKIVPIRVPMWQTGEVEPLRLDASLFDIGADSAEENTLVESQNYGTSLIETAFGPWMDLQDAILSLNMSRKNASRLERMIGVNTGKLSPQKAAEYLNIVSSQITKNVRVNAERSLKKGFVQTVLNHLIPIFGDGRARLDISTVEGTPNIEALADIDFHVKRLGSAVGVDPALLGFGEMLAGGLGDGGFFRLSIQAGIQANLIRKAVSSAAERLCEIHAAYKYGKVFLPEEKPWRVVFNSVSTAMEREERENMEARANFATGIAGLMQMADPEFTTGQRPEFMNYLWTDVMKVPEEKYALIFPKVVTLAAPPAGEEGAAPPSDEEESDDMLTESAKANIDNYIAKLYGTKE
jgi:hypothetical protein